MSWVAKYDGWCGSCGDEIIAGEDEIEYNAADQLVHVNCDQAKAMVAAEERTQKVAAVCDRCWTELPASGVCGVCG